LPPIRSLELLEDLLAAQVLTPAELDDLIQNHPDEDQYVDFKDGLLMQDLPKARATVRQYVSGFANAIGGTLIVGVNEPARAAGGARPARTVSPCARSGGQPLDQWATRLLNDLAAYFSPPPRIQVVTHAAGEVLVIATARAPRLVPLVEGGQLTYYFRLHESTVKAHDWLISDLVLGRRNHPIVELTLRVDGPAPEPADVLSVNGRNIYQGILLQYLLDIVNASLVNAEYVDAGVITWACTPNPRRPHHELLAYLDAGQSPGAGDDPANPGKPVFVGEVPAWQLQLLSADRSHNRPQQLRPFMDLRAHPEGKALYPRMNRGQCQVTVAVYVMPSGAPPTWFEVEFRYGPDGRVSAGPTVTAVPVGRARVEWRYLG